MEVEITVLYIMIRDYQVRCFQARSIVCSRDGDRSHQEELKGWCSEDTKLHALEAIISMYMVRYNPQYLVQTAYMNQLYTQICTTAVGKPKLTMELTGANHGH